MTLKDYELKFYDELVDNYDGSVRWPYYVRACYKLYMDNKDEQKIAEWEDSR